MEAHPQAVLATVGGASFVAGVLVGSRLVRTILSAAIPFGVQYVLESELGPRLWRYLQDIASRETGPTAPTASSAS